MGTPEFAVPSLKALLDHGHHLASVYCQPDRPKGRGRRPQPCPVKQFALERGIQVVQPESLRGRDSLERLKGYRPDAIIVAAYGKILRQSILDLAPLGAINVHASLLPRWRGASPIHHSILAGDQETGISIMKMTRGLDAGPIYSQARVTIQADALKETLEEQLADLGAQLLVDTLPQLPYLPAIDQDESQVTLAPIITKQMGFIRFGASAFAIERMTRAFHQWPGSWCSMHQQRLKLVELKPWKEDHNVAPGTVLLREKRRCLIACGEGTVMDLVRVQPAGKSVMPIAAFLAGHHFERGFQFGELGDPDANSSE